MGNPCDEMRTEGEMTENEGFQRPPNESDEQESETAQRRYSLDELTDLAGVTIRTVRYYISEGLLPPPIGAGPRSVYTDVHLNRLRLISRLKDAYLPLREIRRQLQGMTDEDIVRTLNDANALPPTAPKHAEPAPGEHGRSERSRGRHGRGRTMDESREDAADYIGRVLRESSPDAQFRRGHRGRHGYRSSPTDEVNSSMPVGRVDLPGVMPPTIAGDQSQSWKRLAITPEAELLIEDEAYVRRREQIDAAIDWIRRILNN